MFQEVFYSMQKLRPKIACGKIHLFQMEVVFFEQKINKIRISFDPRSYHSLTKKAVKNYWRPTTAVHLCCWMDEGINSGIESCSGTATGFNGSMLQIVGKAHKAINKEG